MHREASGEGGNGEARLALCQHCHRQDNKDVFIVGSVEDITVNLEDSLVTISTIAGSRFVGPIRDEVEKWQKDPCACTGGAWSLLA